MKKLLFSFGILLLLGAGIGYWAYSQIFSSNTAVDQKTAIYIPTNSTFDEVKNILRKENILSNMGSFERVSSWMKYGKDNKVSSGKYIIHPNENNKTIISRLRAGNQAPVNVTFNNARTLAELAGDLSQNIELDSLDILDYISDEKNQEKYKLNPETMMTLFIPNTYQMYWNTSVEKLVDRLAKEHKKFWTKDKMALAKKSKMTAEEVYTLASIVEKESVNKKEQPIIAGLYLNRLRRGIKLQADPTVVFANQDFTIRRVLNKHLKFDSPYNTYMYEGLPPGPIGMPSINAINSVLKPTEHEYIYMCAKPGYQSIHVFARNVNEHNRNARIYRNWLNKEGIRR